MAPLHKAISVHSTSSTGEYEGIIDPEWVVGAVPNGGYLLALVVEACIQYQYQSKSSHSDPIHVTAHFLRTSAVSRFVIRVRTLKSGRGFTNLLADLVQQGDTKITTHLIFGNNAPSPSDGAQPRLTLAPPSRFARRIPLYTHPSTAVVKPMRHTWGFHSHVKWTDEPEILAKNKPDSANRTDSTTVGGGGLDWGAWFEFVDEDVRITNSSLAFLVDIFLDLPTLLPRSERVGLTTSWYPTMTLAIEFKSPIPQPSSAYANRTVGLYSSGRFINDPQGRHDAYVEVWTAPCNIGDGGEAEGWRDKQVCLAVATQMALTVPIEVNREKAKRGAVKL